MEAVVHADAGIDVGGIGLDELGTGIDEAEGCAGSAPAAAAGAAQAFRLSSNHARIRSCVVAFESVISSPG